MNKPLKVWNGRSYGWYIGGKTVRCIYVCAYSMADAIRLLESLGSRGVTRTEMNDYFSPCWGNAMDGVTPERGAWVQFNGDNWDEKPVRVKEAKL